MFFTVALSALATLLPFACALDGPSMSLTNGRFFGLNNDDMEFEMYRGVPFAQPPVGDLRFRKAQPVQPMEGDREATVFPKACIQSPDNQDQSEDCLYMNIYRPYGTSEGSGLPILVMIHGGSWQGGSAFGPGWDMLKRARDEGRPFIHIGIQYRLNAFGLLASEGMDQGDLNAALSDQQEALRFVKNNARQMGGDPDKVVLGGQSAGASGASLNWLYSNPEEKLFRGVYMSSGGPTQYPVNAVADYDLPDGPTTRLINMASCQRDNKRDSIQCLREKPIEELRIQTHAVMTRNGTAPGHVTTWPPCLDGLFVKDRNSKWMAEGKFNKVPILSGRNRDEGTVFTPGDIRDEAGIRDMLTSVLIPAVIPDDKFAGLMATLPTDPPSGSPYGTGDNVFGHDPIWKRAASAFGDWKYTTASIYSLRTAAAAGVDAWGYLWLPPSGDNGATHGTDTGIIFSGNPPADPMGLAMQQGVIRFITDLNPNNDQTGKEWPNYRNGAFVMKFDKTVNFIQSDDYRKPFNDYCINNFEAWKK